MTKVHGRVAVLATAKQQGRDRHMVATYSRPEAGSEPVVVRARVAPVRRALDGTVISGGIL